MWPTKELIINKIKGRDTMADFSIEAGQILQENRTDIQERINLALKEAYKKGKDSLRTVASGDITHEGVAEFDSLMTELKHKVVRKPCFGEPWNKVEERFLMAAFATFIADTATAHGRSIKGIQLSYKLLRSKGWDPWK